MSFELKSLQSRICAARITLERISDDARILWLETSGPFSAVALDTHKSLEDILESLQELEGN